MYSWSRVRGLDPYLYVGHGKRKHSKVLRPSPARLSFQNALAGGLRVDILAEGGNGDKAWEICGV